jgi:phage pi2 protein 07
VTFEISMIAWAAIMLTYGFVWSRNERRKIAKVKFVNNLNGYKFNDLKELQAHWRDRGIVFKPVGEFDPKRFGDLQETLKFINDEFEQRYGSWQ